MFCSVQRPAAGLQPQHNLPVLFNGPGYSYALLVIVYGLNSKWWCSQQEPPLCEPSRHFNKQQQLVSAWPYGDHIALLSFHQGGPGPVSLI